MGATTTDTHERRFLRADGTSVWVVHSTGLVRDEADQPRYYVSHIQDSTDSHHATEALAHRASHDPLTGLTNRTHLQEQITNILHRTPRRGGPMALMFCDVDNFKRINDTYGHAVGDEVLRTTAQRAASALRTADIIARLGGDEFVAVLPEVHDLTAAAKVAEKVQAAVRKPLPIGEEHIVVTLSIGIALAELGIDANRLISHADAAMYQAKNAGRDRVAMFRDLSV